MVEYPAMSSTNATNLEPGPLPPAPPEGAVRIAFFGDVVGEPGRKALAARIKPFKAEKAVDFVIVNGENSAGGRGITSKIAIGLLRAGAAVITTGDHVWDQHETANYIDTEPRLLRPLNFPEGTPGAGSVVLPTDKGEIAVVNAIGRTFIQPPLENPFLAVDAEIARLKEKTPVVFVDFHAEATSEKIGMGRYLDGKASAVVGTHTHVQTADEQIFPGGTAFLCDAGMCGPAESILGCTPEPILKRFETSMPARFNVAKGTVKLCGAIVDVDTTTGRALGIERIAEVIPATS